MKNFKTVYAYDEQGKICGETLAQKDKKGNVMMPANSTEQKPLDAKEGFDVIYVDGAWSYVEVPKEPEIVQPEPVEPTYAELRAAEYPNVGEQLDAIWKELNVRRMNGDDLCEDADSMLSKVLGVKKKHPKPKGEENA